VSGQISYGIYKKQEKVKYQAIWPSLQLQNIFKTSIPAKQGIWLKVKLCMNTTQRMQRGREIIIAPYKIHTTFLFQV
jgi:hypothetical protein